MKRETLKNLGLVREPEVIRNETTEGELRQAVQNPEWEKQLKA